MFHGSLLFFEAFWEPGEYSTPDTGESYAELHKVFYSITCFINETKTQILLPLLYVSISDCRHVLFHGWVMQGSFMRSKMKC